MHRILEQGLRACSVMAVLLLSALPGRGQTLTVRNRRWELFNPVLSVPLSPASAKAVQDHVLAEGATGRGSFFSPVPYAVDASIPGHPVLSCMLPGIVEPGEVHLLQFVAPGATTAGATGNSDLNLQITDREIIIGNSYFEVRHPRRGGGGFPGNVLFRISGRRDTHLHFFDRLFSRNGTPGHRNQYMAENDPEATAKVVFRSPVRVVVEAHTRYVLNGKPATGTPRITYRYVYTPFSPVVRVDAVAERDDDEPWPEQHFLHLTRNEYYYTAFVTGPPPALHPMQKPGVKSRNWSGAEWAVMSTAADAAGVGGGPVICWDASDEFYYYIRAATPSWTTRRRELHGTLYFGPASADPAWYSRWLAKADQPTVRLKTGANNTAQTTNKTEFHPAYALENDALRVGFADATHGFDCIGIENRLKNSMRFVHTRAESAGLWRLEFRTPYRAVPKGSEKKPQETVFLDNRSPGHRRAEFAEQIGVRQLTLTWTGLALPGEPAAVDVTVTVRLPVGTGPSEWRIAVRNRSKRFGLWQTSFPRLTTVFAPGTGDALLPRGNWGGTLYRNSKAGARMAYPSAACPMQFMAFNLGDAGLYVAAHDGQANTKTLAVTPQQDAAIETVAENMGVPGAAGAPTFPAIVAAFRGDWWQAAHIYRAWAVKQVWTRKGWIEERKDVPAKIKDIGLWWLGGGDPKGVRAMMLQAEAACGSVPIGLHWYSWHQIPFDNSYPNYFPTKPGFSEVVHALTARGQVIMPYINGRLWDRDIPSFPAKGIKAACKQPNGDVYTEVYGSGRRLAPMCPSTKLWQDTIYSICHRLMHECGVNAIYLDQIGAARPRLCFDPSHGHPLGGGHYWVDRYRTLLNRVKADAMALHVGLTTENTAEPYMDNIDAYLAWNPRFDTDVPLLPAVYSGYTIYFTSPQDARDDLDAFVAAQGRDFLWGCQIGWNGDWLLDDKHRKYLDFELKLSQARLAAKEFMVFGRLLDEVRPSSPVPRVTTVWHRTAAHSATLPAVMGTLWQSRHGKLGIVLLNITDRPRRIAYALQPGKWLANSATEAWEVQRLTSAGSAPWSLATGPTVAREDILGPREVRVLAIAPARSAVVATAAAQRARSGRDPVLAQCAREFLFSQALRRAGLAITGPALVQTIVRGEPLELTLAVSATAAHAPPVTVHWPDNADERCELRKGKKRTLRRLLRVDAASNGARTVVVGVNMPGASRAYRVRLLDVPAVSVELGCPNAVYGGESFLTPLTVRNNSHVARSVRLLLETPSDWRVEPGNRCELGRLAPGEQRSMLVKCRVPPAVMDSRVPLRALVVDAAEAHELTVRKSRLQARAVYFAKPPGVDGKLGDWPNSAGIHLGPPQTETVKIKKDYGGAADCSADVRLGWDKAFLYLAAHVRDDVQHQERDDFQLWQGDCIQLAFRNGPPNTKPGYDGSEYEVGLTLGPNGPVLFQWAPGAAPVKGGKLAVHRGAGETVYEAAVPWSALGISSMTAGRRVGWSMTVNDNDGKGFEGWLEWTPGVCGGKDSSTFGWFEAIRK